VFYFLAVRATLLNWLNWSVCMPSHRWTLGERLVASLVTTVMLLTPWAVIAVRAVRGTPWTGSLFLPTLASVKRLYVVAQAAARFILTGTTTRFS
jgi:hypothetical protein